MCVCVCVVVVVGFKYHEYHPLATPQKEFCEDTILPIFGVQKGWSATKPPIWWCFVQARNRRSELKNYPPWN